MAQPDHYRRRGRGGTFLQCVLVRRRCCSDLAVRQEDPTPNVRIRYLASRPSRKHMGPLWSLDGGRDPDGSRRVWIPDFAPAFASSVRIAAVSAVLRKSAPD